LEIVNRRRAIWIGLFAAVITLFVALFLVVSADGPINRTAFNQIKQGMSEKECWRILGQPMDSWQSSYTTRDEVGQEEKRNGKRCYWYGPRKEIEVEFDDQFKVAWKRLREIQGPSLRLRLRDLWWSVRRWF
jgi:hypothetical protein